MFPAARGSGHSVGYFLSLEDEGRDEDDVMFFFFFERCQFVVIHREKKAES